jgi:hypothetical protein
MKKSFLNISLIAIGLTVFTSCKNLLNVEPRQSIDATTALTNEPALQAALRGTYDRLQSVDLYGSSQIAFAEALSDNGRARNTNLVTTNSGRLAGQLQNLPGSHLVGWTQYYLMINQANLILEAVPKVQGLSLNARNSIEGQAYFLRALAYHDLVKSYAYEPGVEVAANDRGGVPIVLEGVLDASQIKFPARALVSEVYDQIYKDLDAASEKLSSVTGIATPAFAGLAATNALYARVALFRRDYATAATKASLALVTGAPAMVASTGYRGSWRSPSQGEAIFELPFTTPENIGVNVSLQSYFTSTVSGQSTSLTGGFGDLVVNDAYGVNLLTQGSIMPSGVTITPAFTINRDERFVQGSTTEDGIIRPGSPGRGNAGVREMTKFYGRGGQINLDNIPLIRTAEVILTLAEAQYYLGNTSAAQANLALVIRNRYTNAGSAIPTTSTVTVSLTGQSLIDEILRQRRLELAFEGHRFFDLKRNGSDMSRPWGTLSYVDFRVLPPIPQSEIDANPKLVQNAGY